MAAVAFYSYKTLFFLFFLSRLFFHSSLQHLIQLIALIEAKHSELSRDCNIAITLQAVLD